jgi:hypothetical protein
MQKLRKNKIVSVTKVPVRGVESNAMRLAEELILGSGDTESTRDEAVTLLCGKPPRGKFFRVHPSKRVDIRLLKVKIGVREDRFVVAKSVAGKLDYITATTAFLCVTLEGIPFLWLISVGDDTWSTSARHIAVNAMTQWIRLVPNSASGTYHQRVAKDKDRKPDFKGLDKKPFEELLLMAFDGDHIIKTVDHPVAQEILSE